MRKLLLIIIITFGMCEVVSAQQSTSDSVLLSSVTDDKGGVLDTVLLADGNVKVLVFALHSDERRYSAWNLDLTLPEGAVLCQSNGKYDVSLPNTSSLFLPADGNLTHRLYSNRLSSGDYRLACFSSENESFHSEAGELFVVRVILPVGMGTGTYTIRLSGINLTAVKSSSVSKYIPDDCEFTLRVLSVHDMFSDYKSTQRAVLSSLPVPGDSDDVLSVIRSGQSCLDSLSYDVSLSLADNKQAVDSIVSRTTEAVEAQRALEHSLYSTHRDSVLSVARSLAPEDCSAKVREIVDEGVDSLQSCPYDSSQTVYANMAALDLLLGRVREAVNAQLAKEEQLAADKASFMAYRDSLLDIVVGLAQDGDPESVLSLISEARDSLSALDYDNTLSLEENKSRAHSLLVRLQADVEQARQEAVGISAVVLDEKRRVLYYDMTGVRVKHPRRGGIYVVNGKKVFFHE